jgi:hypothetical protein
MSTAEKFKDYAADCVHKAGEATTPEDKTLLLNMGLAWLRLAQQVEAIRTVSEDATAEFGLEAEGAAAARSA